MAENMTKIPDAEKREELKAYAEERKAKAAKDKAESFRVQALNLAVQNAEDGTAALTVVAKALVFEHYLTTGELIGADAFATITQNVVAGNDAAGPGTR